MRRERVLNRLYTRAAVLLKISVIAFLAACANESSSVDKGDSWAELLDKGSGILRALYVPAEGFAYLDDEGRLTGVTVELIRDMTGFLKEKYDVVIEIEFEEEENWAVFYRRIVEGGDGLIGFGNVTITEDRKKELMFSPPYMNNIASLITNSDVPELKRFEDMSVTFEGMKALAFRGTLHEARLRKLAEDHYPSAEIHFATTNDEILNRVGESTAYFAYIDLYNYLRASNREELQRHSIADDPGEQFGYIMPLNTTWNEVIGIYFKHNEGLTQSKRYREIMEEHLGRDLASSLIDGS